MFCCHCGKPAAGRFCSSCGKPLVILQGVAGSNWDEVAPASTQGASPVIRAEAHLATATASRQSRGTLSQDVLVEKVRIDGPVVYDAADEIIAAEVDWDNELRYEALVRVPAVRAMIDRHARMAKKGLSAEKFLELCDKLMPMGIPMESLASAVQPIYASWGIKTGQQRTETIAAGVGRAMVRALCSLARRGQALRTVRQAQDGCSLEASLPSDMLSFEGDLLVTIHGRGRHTAVEAATNIPGQWFDWGKSRRALDRLFADLHVDPA